MAWWLPLRKGAGLWEELPLAVLKAAQFCLGQSCFLLRETSDNGRCSGLVFQEGTVYLLSLSSDAEALTLPQGTPFTRNGSGNLPAGFQQFWARKRGEGIFPLT